MIYLTGGLANSPEIVPGLGITVALVFMSIPMMWAPGLANILTRLVSREGWRSTYLRPLFKHGAWKAWLSAWLVPPVLVALGMAIYFGSFPRQLDSSMAIMAAQVEQQIGGGITPETFRLLMVIQVLSGFLTAPLLNSLFTFGEEFGWRAYLQPKLMPLGRRTALVVVGIIWGIWHWPVILMGYEYGFNYPGYPVVGPLFFLVFTISLAVIEGWMTIKSRSVWPAVIAHAMVNGFAGLPTMFVAAGVQPNLLLGPYIVGIIAGIPMLVFAAALLIHPTALQEPTAEAIDVELPSAVKPAYQG